ncbi:MAG TPA: hypothetical protein DEV81_10585 [Cyanobacteria bacterium UBA11049]|nr:hypothetical protein [Cyanobacteria bacterium UBA11049]
MPNLTLQQLFGANATQSATQLVIKKSDLSELTANGNNTAESLLAAVLLQAWNEFEGVLVDEQGEAIVSEKSEAIGYDQRELFEKLRVWFWKRQFVEGKVLDTFVIDCFVKPPTAYGIALNANQL